MKICSIDNKCFAAIEYTVDGEGYGSFQVAVYADIGHGKFDAKNVDVQFLNLEEFVAEFDAFILDRKRAPRLEGTYDTYFAFSASGSTVILKYHLGGVVCGQKISSFYQSGEFELDQQNLLPIVAGFRSFIVVQQGIAGDSRIPEA